MDENTEACVYCETHIGRRVGFCKRCGEPLCVDHAGPDITCQDQQLCDEHRDPDTAFILKPTISRN